MELYQSGNNTVQEKPVEKLAGKKRDEYASWWLLGGWAAAPNPGTDLNQKGQWF